MQEVAEQLTVPLERTGVAGRQFDRATEFALGAVEVTGIRSCVPRLACASPSSGASTSARSMYCRARACLLGGHVPRVFAEQLVGIGCGDVGARVVGVDRDRALEMRRGRAHVVDFALRQQRDALEVLRAGLDVFGALLRQSLLVARRQGHLQRAHDFGRDFVLDLEHVGELAIEMLRPQMRAV